MKVVVPFNSFVFFVKSTDESPREDECERFRHREMDIAERSCPVVLVLLLSFTSRCVSYSKIMCAGYASVRSPSASVLDNLVCLVSCPSCSYRVGGVG